MNLTDLKRVLDERSRETAEQAVHRSRLHGVRAKVRARRRRRIAAWATAGVAVAAAVTFVLPGLRPDLTPTPAVSPSPTPTIEGFPEYANGARVVAARSAPLSARQVEVTVVPTTLDLVIFTRCDGVDENIAVERTVRVGSRVVADGTCHDGSLHPADWAGLGVTVGQPATVVLTITGAYQSGDAGEMGVPVPERGEVGLAIGARMPFDDYPLPPRPGVLTPLNQASWPAGCSETVCQNVIVIRSDPDDPTRPVSTELDWPTVTSIDMVSQTPGLLRVQVAGVQVAVGEWWDYQLTGAQMYGDADGQWKRDFDLDLRRGDRVRIEVVPAQVTGAWQVVLTPAVSTGG
ncbi:hypothetical protein [Micromonospora maris]|uniref:hypothetical protein n=1 Tax=Micromonospora maris TaxID=1003110 RepID=UPI002E1183D5|nr:hypothetical protein OG712_24085 [Micromonospora maris]